MKSGGCPLAKCSGQPVCCAFTGDAASKLTMVSAASRFMMNFMGTPSILKESNVSTLGRNVHITRIKVTLRAQR